MRRINKLSSNYNQINIVRLSADYEFKRRPLHLKSIFHSNIYKEDIIKLAYYECKYTSLSSLKERIEITVVSELSEYIGYNFCRQLPLFREHMTFVNDCYNDRDTRKYIQKVRLDRLKK